MAPFRMPETSTSSHSDERLRTVSGGLNLALCLEHDPQEGEEEISEHSSLAKARPSSSFSRGDNIEVTRIGSLEGEEAEQKQELPRLGSRMQWLATRSGEETETPQVVPFWKSNPVGPSQVGYYPPQKHNLLPFSNEPFLPSYRYPKTHSNFVVFPFVTVISWPVSISERPATESSLDSWGGFTVDWESIGAGAWPGQRWQFWSGVYASG